MKYAPHTASSTPASQHQRFTPRRKACALAVLPAPSVPRPGGAAAASSGPSSLSSQSRLTPRALASGRSLPVSGTDSPVSHLEMACRETPSRSASASCERPAFLRQRYIFSLSFMASSCCVSFRL